jgi:hypothetical protein
MAAEGSARRGTATDEVAVMAAGSLRYPVLVAGKDPLEVR